MCTFFNQIPYTLRDLAINMHFDVDDRFVWLKNETTIKSHRKAVMLIILELSAASYVNDQTAGYEVGLILST